MRKILLLIFTLSWTFASMMTLRGSLGANMALDGKTSNYAIHGQFMHFIPMLPNIRIEKSKDTFREDLDAIFFYNILDETFFLSLDLGIGAKIKKVSSIKYDEKMPTVFLGTKIDLPLSNLSLKTRTIATQKDKDVSHKAEIMVEYKVMDNLFVDFVVDVGYRDEYFSNKDINKKRDIMFFEFNFTI